MDQPETDENSGVRANLAKLFGEMQRKNLPWSRMAEYATPQVVEWIQKVWKVAYERGRNDNQGAKFWQRAYANALALAKHNEYGCPVCSHFRAGILAKPCDQVLKYQEVINGANEIVKKTGRESALVSYGGPRAKHSTT